MRTGNKYQCNYNYFCLWWANYIDLLCTLITFWMARSHLLLSEIYHATPRSESDFRTLLDGLINKNQHISNDKLGVFRRAYKTLCTSMDLINFSQLGDFSAQKPHFISTHIIILTFKMLPIQGIKTNVCHPQAFWTWFSCCYYCLHFPHWLSTHFLPFDAINSDGGQNDRGNFVVLQNREWNETIHLAFISQTRYDGGYLHKF